MKKFSLTIRNITRKPGRSLALMLLTAFLAMSLFGGAVVIGSLKQGLGSLESRLGADIIVLPSSAESKVSFKNMLLQGTTGAFYLEAEALERVREVRGVEIASPQTFLASLKADCCSIKIQVIGLDTGTDFTIRPWIEESTSASLGEMELAVGCNVGAGVGDTLKIYEQRCKVVSRLAPTGTGLDSAVYCNMDTMRLLLRAAEEKGVSHKIKSDSEDVISAIYVKVRDGFDIGQVNSELNGHVRNATAVRTKSMITQVSDSLAGVARTVSALIAAIWVLALVILLIAYAMMTRERAREFAVLRLIGMSRKRLSGLMLKEAAFVSFTGALAGTALAAAVVFPFTALIEESLALPYLAPSASETALRAAEGIGLTTLVGALASAFAAWRLGRVDPGTTLREGT